MMAKRILLAAAAIALVVAALGIYERGRATEMRTVAVPMRIDAENIGGLDPWSLTEPVFWTANTTDGPEAYEKSLVPFTRAQRLFSAVTRYKAEVDNGGHGQFYGNSTGIVWQDALAGLEVLQLHDLAEILRESARRLGGDPPLDWEARNELLEQLRPDFSDLDLRLWDLEDQLNQAIVDYARSHPEEFYFDGVVQQPHAEPPVFYQHIFWTF